MVCVPAGTHHWTSRLDQCNGSLLVAVAAQWQPSHVTYWQLEHKVHHCHEWPGMPSQGMCCICTQHPSRFASRNANSVALFSNSFNGRFTVWRHQHHKTDPMHIHPLLGTLSACSNCSCICKELKTFDMPPDQSAPLEVCQQECHLCRPLLQLTGST